MSTPQVQNNSQTISAVNSANAQVDKGNSDKAKSSSIFGRAAKVAYDIVTFIPRKVWAGIKFIHNKIQTFIHDREVRAVQAKNSAYIARAKAACPFTGKTWREDDILKHRSDLVRTELLQRVHDVKGRDFSSKVLGSSPSHMRKGIIAADKQAAVTSHVKKDVRLQKQYEKLGHELQTLEDNKSALELELDEIAKKFKTVELREGNGTTVAKELRRVFKAKQTQMEQLESAIKSKGKALHGAYEAHAKHIGDQDIPLDVPVVAKEAPKPVTKAELKAGIAKAAEVLTADEEWGEFQSAAPKSSLDAAIDGLHDENEKSKSLLGRAKKFLADRKQKKIETAEQREMTELQDEMILSPQQMAAYDKSRKAETAPVPTPRKTVAAKKLAQKNLDEFTSNPFAGRPTRLKRISNVKH